MTQYCVDPADNQVVDGNQMCPNNDMSACTA